MFKKSLLKYVRGSVSNKFETHVCCVFILDLSKYG